MPKRISRWKREIDKEKLINKRLSTEIARLNNSISELSDSYEYIATFLPSNSSAYELGKVPYTRELLRRHYPLLKMPMQQEQDYYSFINLSRDMQLQAIASYTTDCITRLTANFRFTSLHEGYFDFTLDHNTTKENKRYAFTYYLTETALRNATPTHIVEGLVPSLKQLMQVAIAK
jgi:hypothetical protein